MRPYIRSRTVLGYSSSLSVLWYCEGKVQTYSLFVNPPLKTKYRITKPIIWGLKIKKMIMLII